MRHRKKVLLPNSVLDVTLESCSMISHSSSAVPNYIYKKEVQKLTFLNFTRIMFGILMSVLVDPSFHSWITLWRNHLKLCHFNFTICGWNLLVLPFKRILTGMTTFAKYYLFLMILQKEIWNFSDFFFGHLYRNERIPNNINTILIFLPHLSVVSPLDTSNRCSEGYTHCKKNKCINLHWASLNSTMLFSLWHLVKNLINLPFPTNWATAKVELILSMSEPRSLITLKQ